MRSSEKSPNNFRFAYFVLQRCLTRSWAMSACVLSKCYYMHTNTEREKNSHGIIVWFSCPKSISPLHLGKVHIFFLSPFSKQKEGSGQCSGLGTEQAHGQAGHNCLTSLPVLCSRATAKNLFPSEISIRRLFMQQASGFQVVHTASKMAIGHYSCLLIHNELSNYKRRQWHYWNGNLIRALTGNIRRWILSLRNKVSEK